MVRISPGSLSCINPSAWKHILEQRQGQKKFRKDSIIYGKRANDVDSLPAANDSDHAGMRRLLAYAFSEKALKVQKPLLQSYVESLMNRLHEQVIGPADGKVDMVKGME